MANPYGITLSPVWTEWAAHQRLSETIAAAVYLLWSENRKVEEIVGKLNPGEIERVIDIIGRQPDRFPPGTLAALKNSRPTTPPEPSAGRATPGAGPTQPAAHRNPDTERMRQARMHRTHAGGR